MSLPQPCLVAGRRAVRRVLEALPVGSVVVVGCSGGADSLALAACVAHETSGPRAGRQLVVRAVVVDHGMQTPSAEVAQDAAATSERLGLTARVVRVDVGTDGGPEAAARAARYAALEGVLDAEVAAAGAPGGVVLVGTRVTTRPRRSCSAWRAARAHAPSPGCAPSVGGCVGPSSG